MKKSHGMIEMGWNCNNCGHLLKPAPEYIDELAKILWSFVPKERLFPVPKGEPGAWDCENCGAKFLILQGEQPRIYLGSIMVCIVDGEGDVHG